MKYEISASEIMSTPVVSIGADETVFEAAKLMDREKIGTIIVTVDKRPIGIVTEKDVVTRLVAKGDDPKKVKIGDLMTAPIMVANPEADVNEIAKKMAEKAVRRVPIVDSGEIVGMVTERDILDSEPALIDAMKEVVKIRGDSSTLSEQIEPMVGICEECDEYSEELRYDGGRYLCPECRGS